MKHPENPTTRRRLQTALLVAAALALGAPALPVAAADETTRIVVSFPPGGPVDRAARTIADQLGKELAAKVIVENKAGANGAIGAEAVARAEPDGLTIWLTSVGAAAINPALYDKLRYDMKRDFAPVALVVNNVEVMVVNPANPAKDARQFVANAKAAGRQPVIASTGSGSIPHLVLEQFADKSGTKVLHVPYKGAAPAITDLLGGQVEAFFGDVPGLIGHVQSGRLRAVGLAAEKRHPLLPDVPTLGELGVPGVDSDNWYGLFVPAKTPKATIDRLNAAVRRTMSAPAVRDKLASTGAEAIQSSPQELADRLARDTAKWAALIKAKGIRLQ